MTHVYIAGVGMTPLGKHPEKSVKQLTGEAVVAALQDAGCGLDVIDAAWFANTRQGLMEGQNTIRGQCALRPLGLEGVPIVNVENACASSSTAVLQAFAHLRAGLHGVALVVGAEKMFFPDRMKEVLGAFRGGWDVHDEERSAERLLALGEGLDLPEDAADTGGDRSVFMDIYASLARQHMRLFGTTREQIAAVAAKNHRHSTLNPLAQYRFDLTVQQVLDDRPVSWPLTRAMCAPVSDGAAALILCRDDALERTKAGSRAVRIRGISLASGSEREADDLDRHIGAVAARQAYEAAGIGPEEVSVAEVHDATAFAEILQVENLGLCPRGAGGRLAETGATALGGSVPVNTSGGLISKGHPIGATGAIQLHELVLQLRGEAGERQVEGARVAVAENGGGFHGFEEAATVVTVLARH